MTTKVKLTDAHVGKFTVVRAVDKSAPVKIIVVGGGTCVFTVLDDNMPLRSGKIRFDPEQWIDIYDTAEEAIAWEKE